MYEVTSEISGWTPVKKISFRFFFCFFTIHFCLNAPLYFMIFGLNIPVFLWFDKLYAPWYHFVNDHILHLKQAHTDLKLNEFIFHLMAITTAFMATIIWSVFDRKRKSYAQADFWLRHALKYILAIIIFSYGIDKLIPNQMSLPDTSTLDAPVGDFSPFYLFWTLMGSHTFYQSFTGLVEITAAFLLVFNRTHVMGLIVLTGTLINVLMLNIGFDISVTYFVTLLLVACLYLLFPFLASISQFIFNLQPTELYKPSILNNSKRFKVIFILSAIVFMASIISNTIDNWTRYAKTVKQEDATRTFHVLTQTRNSDTLKMVLDDKARWKYWIEYKKEGKNYLSLLTMNDTITFDYLFEKDTTKKIIELKPAEKSEDSSRYSFIYSMDSGKGEQILSDSTHKMVLVIKEFKKEEWELLKPRNKFFPFDF